MSVSRHDKQYSIKLSGYHVRMSTPLSHIWTSPDFIFAPRVFQIWTSLDMISGLVQIQFFPL